MRISWHVSVESAVRLIGNGEGAPSQWHFGAARLAETISVGRIPTRREWRPGSSRSVCKGVGSVETAWNRWGQEKSPRALKLKGFCSLRVLPGHPGIFLDAVLVERRRIENRAAELARAG